MTETSVDTATTESTEIDNTAQTSDITTPQNTNSFQDLLPEEYKNVESLKQYKDLNGFIKSHLEQEKMVGRAVAHIPKEDSTQEQWDKYFAKIGRPESVDKYNIPEIEKPEDYVSNDELIGIFKELSHKSGLTQKQFESILNGVESYSINAYNSLKEEQNKKDAEFESLLDKTFGNEKESTINNVKNLIRENLSPELGEGLANLNDRDFVSVAILLNNFQKKYINSDTLQVNNNIGSSSEQIRKEIDLVTEELNKTSPFDAKYESLRQQKRGLYTQLSQSLKKA